MARRELTDEEYEAKVREIEAWCEQNPDPQPKVLGASFDACTRRVLVELEGGSLIGLPLSNFPGLDDATDEEIASQIQIEDDAVWWEGFDDSGNDVFGTLLRVMRIKEWAGRYLGPVTLVPPPEPPGVSLWVDEDDDANPGDERIAAD